MELSEVIEMLDNELCSLCGTPLILTFKPVEKHTCPQCKYEIQLDFRWYQVKIPGQDSSSKEN